MKKVEVIVRTTEDNFPPQEKVVLKFTEQTVSSAENDAVLSYPGLEIHLEHHRVFKNGQEVYMSRYEYGVLSLMARHPGQLFTKEQHLFISERFPTLATNSCRLFPQNP